MPRASTFLSRARRIYGLWGQPPSKITKTRACMYICSYTCTCPTRRQTFFVLFFIVKVSFPIHDLIIKTRAWMDICSYTRTSPTSCQTFFGSFFIASVRRPIRDIVTKARVWMNICSYTSTSPAHNQTSLLGSFFIAYFTSWSGHSFLRTLRSRRRSKNIALLHNTMHGIDVATTFLSTSVLFRHDLAHIHTKKYIQSPQICVQTHPKCLLFNPLYY
mmetsp:Transcript_35627/g.56976  ORF Transcript_35627/g.56976 Transcript_35627/m.56976 type:complete len:217 (-) Transcript_35627:597-1247(-)